MLGDGIDVLKSVFRCFKRMKRGHFNHALESGKIRDARLNLIIIIIKSSSRASVNSDTVRMCVSK